MIKNIHRKAVKSKTPFSNAVIAAYVAGFGAVFCLIGDLVWLFGDMAIKVHPHHWLVLSLFIPANLLILSSFAWLYISINIFLSKKENKNTLTNRERLENIICRFKATEDSIDTSALSELDRLNSEVVHLVYEEITITEAEASKTNQ